jgi:hypothetical protein
MAATLGILAVARRKERCDLYDHERRATKPAAKRPASLRVAAKIATGFVERLDRIADTLFAFLLPGPRFLAATRLMGIMSLDPKSDRLRK